MTTVRYAGDQGVVFQIAAAPEVWFDAWEPRGCYHNTNRLLQRFLDKLIADPPPDALALERPTGDCYEDGVLNSRGAVVKSLDDYVLRVLARAPGIVHCPSCASSYPSAVLVKRREDSDLSGWEQTLCPGGHVLIWTLTWISY